MTACVLVRSIHRSFSLGKTAIPALLAIALSLALSLWSSARAAEPQLFPLEPPDTSSPRAVIESYMRNSEKGSELLHAGKSTAEIIPWFKRANHCFDLSEVSPDRVADVGSETSLLIYEVLIRAGLPDLSEIPGRKEALEGGLTSWRVPRTDIRIVLVSEGDRAGEFLFSPRTVARALEYFQRVQHLPIGPGYPPGSYDIYVTGPEYWLPYSWTLDLPTWAKARVLRNPIWKWIASATAIAIGAAVVFLLYRAGRAWNRRFEKRGGQWRVGMLFFAIGLTVLPIALEFVINDAIGIRFEVQRIVSKTLYAASVIAGVFALLALSNFLAEAVIASRRFRERSVDAHLIKVIARLLGIIACTILVLLAAEFLGFALAPVLAGLGLGGLAVALAARPTLENVIGGFTLFADKPVRIGDYCRFGEEEGWVQEIGLRSTRLRRHDDTVVSVPNADFSQLQLKNYSQRRQRLYRTMLTLRYETTPDQLRYLLAKLREMLVAHPKVSPDRLHVRFDGFGDYSLNVEVFALIRTPLWLEYRAIREDINLRIMEIVAESGTGFAFPSQTAYLSRDHGVDDERRHAAEAKVESWRSGNELPFPEFGAAPWWDKEDDLDYPEKGSPDHHPNEEPADERREQIPDRRPSSRPLKSTAKGG